MVGMAEHGAHDLFGHAALAQDGRASLGMLFEGGVDLPIEIVQQPHQAPGFYILAIFFGVETHGSLHRQHVAHQAFIFHVFANQR